MSLPEPTETFRDPVHGYIGIFDWEKSIIDTQVFQRLRGIRQLGLSSYVYHGAEHSRFGHSLGVMHLAGRFVERILKRPSHKPLLIDRQGWSEGEFDAKVDQLILETRLAGLLHDIGHAPFSHTGENELFAEDKRHEHYSAEILLSAEFEIGAIIDEQVGNWGICKERVEQILNKQGTYAVGFIKELIDSVWDVDKMDYLLRDSLYCGVRYGSYDLDRIVDTITIYDEDPEGALRLGLEYGGIHAIEGFILARYFMFTQVYFHPVRRAYDLILTDFISELLAEFNTRGQYPEKLSEYIEWNDWRVLSELNRRQDENTKNLAWRLAARQHPKPVYETGDHADQLTVNRAMLNLPGKLSEAYQGLKMWQDTAIDHPERFRTEGWPIKQTSGSWASLDRLSKALEGMGPITHFRLYADVRGNDALEEEIQDFCRREMA